jgi:hypothetical protein
MSDVIVFKDANLPSVADLAKSLRNINVSVQGVGGDVLLKMDKTGHWIYGADSTDVEDDSKWAVNPLSFVHGYIAWGEGEVLGERMAPVSQPLPELEPAPAGAQKGWEPQAGFSLKCVSGEDTGLDVRFATNSMGGRKAVQKLALDIAAQVEKNQNKPVPVVKLKKEHYIHNKYGRIYTPVFEIVDWVSMNGEADADSSPAAAPQAEAEAPEGRRRRRGG